MEKMTYAMALDKAMEVVEDVEVREKLEALKEQVTKKYARKSAKVDKNAQIKVDMLASMEVGVAYTISQMIKEFDCFTIDTSNQKVSAILRQLIVDGKIVRDEIKGKAYFTKMEA